MESIGWGIARENGSTGEQLLPSVSPTFEWIRLAQRIPVRLHFDALPKGKICIRDRSSNLGKTPDGSGFGAFLSAFLSHDSADWKSCTGNPFRAGPGICRIFWGMVCRFTKISNVMP